MSFCLVLTALDLADSGKFACTYFKRFLRHKYCRTCPEIDFELDFFVSDVRIEVSWFICTHILIQGCKIFLKFEIVSKL